jgi:hydrogenase/urease accessory protein HupE
MRRRRGERDRNPPSHVGGYHTFATIWRSALLFVLILLTFTAHAHDPGLSTLNVELHNRTIEATMTVAAADAERVHAPNEALELRLDDRAASPIAVRSHRDDKRNVVVQLTFNSDSFSKISLRSRWLVQLPPGHRQFLSVQDPAGHVLREKLLSAKDDSAEFQTAAAPTTPDISAAKHSFSNFLLMGVKHIWTGYDHLLFLFGLLVVTRNFVSAAQIITCFTAAHSLTLAAATFSPVELLPSRIVEPLIAASIVYVGLENILRRGDPRGRWRLTFAFGLIHGLGFASALRELGVGANGGGIAVPLVSFNLGVELGQMAIAALALPLIWKLRTKPLFARRWTPACSACVAVLGGFWFVQRVWF